MRRAGGRQEIEGALVITSEEDIHTFSINIISGEVLKVRAEEAREETDRDGQVEAQHQYVHGRDRQQQEEQEQRYRKESSIKLFLIDFNLGQPFIQVLSMLSNNLHQTQAMLLILWKTYSLVLMINSKKCPTP